MCIMTWFSYRTAQYYFHRTPAFDVQPPVQNIRLPQDSATIQLPHSTIFLNHSSCDVHFPPYRQAFPVSVLSTKFLILTHHSRNQPWPSSHHLSTEPGNGECWGLSACTFGRSPSSLQVDILINTDNSLWELWLRKSSNGPLSFYKLGFNFFKLLLFLFSVERFWIYSQCSSMSTTQSTCWTPQSPFPNVMFLFQIIKISRKRDHQNILIQTEWCIFP